MEEVPKLIEFKIAHKQDKLKKHNEKWKSLNFWTL